MLFSINEEAKEALLSQKDMRGVRNVCVGYKYRSYFNIYSYKYFTDNSKKNDKKRSYDKYYVSVKNKSELDMLYKSFDINYNMCLKIVESKEDKLYDWNIESLEMIIAEFEISITRIISMQDTQIIEYKCTVEDIFEYIKNRDIMVEKINTIRGKTEEFYKMMW